MATLIKLLEILTLNSSSENVLIDRREAKMIPKFNIDNTETKEKYYKAEGKIRKIRRIR